MEIEQITSMLTEKLGQTSFSSRSLSDYVANNLPAEGTEPDDAYFDKHCKILKSFQGNYSADMARTLTEQMPTKSVEYFIKNPEKFKEFVKSHPELLEKPASTEPEEKDAKYKELEDKLEKLLKAQEENDKKATKNQLCSYVKGKANDLNVSRMALWEDAISKVTYEDGDTNETFLNKVKSQYSADVKRYFGDGEKPYNTKGNQGGSGGSGNAIDKYFAKKAAREGWGKSK